MTTNIQQRRENSPNGVDHFHVTRKYSNPVRVLIGDEIVASTAEALVLQEATDELFGPVFYIPRKDVQFNHIDREEHASSVCPIKGTASYFTYDRGNERIEKVAWSYEDPKDYSKMIENHVAFDQNVAQIDILPSA